jgi:hypothetical protein
MRIVRGRFSHPIIQYSRNDRVSIIHAEPEYGKKDKFTFSSLFLSHIKTKEIKDEVSV